MNKLDNIVDLDEFRKKRKEENKPKPHHLKAFEPDQYYIHPELGLMIHVLFVTDKSYHYKNEIDATSIMSEVHTKGKAAAGVYDYQIAETKIHETITAAQEQEFPLKLTGEQVE